MHLGTVSGQRGYTTHRAVLPRLLVLLCALLLAPAGVAAGPSVDIFASASCDGSNEITFQWSVSDTGDPSYPEWTGFDVYRVVAGDCSGNLRVNELPIPRPPESDYQLSIADAPSDLETLYRYEVFPVDDDRNPVGVPFYGNRRQWISCPEGSAAVTVGRLEDIMGWTLNVVPCEDSCYPDAYLEPPYPPELDAAAGTGAVFWFHGQLGCGTVEGCALTVESHEKLPCQVVIPVENTSWGRLKHGYR